MQHLKRIGRAALVALSLGSTNLWAQGETTVPAAREAAREWFRGARFGMFIHWGVYSQLAEG